MEIRNSYPFGNAEAILKKTEALFSFNKIIYESVQIKAI